MKMTMPAAVIKRKRHIKKQKNIEFVVEFYFVDPIMDEPLTRAQLTRFLYNQMGIREEEIAFMYEDFRMYPDRTEAHFGLNGYFIYSQ